MDVIEGNKLTKKALNEFIQWSTSRYNNYCEYGTKRENVDIVFASLLAGHYVGYNGIHETEKKVFIIQCAGGTGESGTGRYWKTKQSGEVYIINCESGTITTEYSKRSISFNKNK